MSFRDILVHVDESKQSPGRLDVAVGLAREYDAHLTGLYVMPDVYIPRSYSGVRYVPPDFLKEHERQGRETAAQAEKAFKDRMRGSDVNVEWRCLRGGIENVITLSARYADLTIVSQADPDDVNQRGQVEMPAEVALTAGRPVLVIPYIGALTPPGRNVIIAWNASREATRSISDAMPILERADRVVVLAVNPDKAGSDHGEVPGADISLHLARHGVRAEAAQTVTGDVSVSDSILSYVYDIGMDLLVMGAYGHSRTREWIVGGVTRDILRRMTIPVLMSH